VAASTGHAPGKAGFKMAVDPSGRQCGTIGGGAIEHEAVAEARALLDMRRPLSRVSRKVHQPGHPDASGMNCGGSQTVVIHPCRPRDRAAINGLLEALEAGQPGTLRLSPRGLAFTPQGRQPRRFRDPAKPEAWAFTERIRVPDTLYLIGGGHVALALSRVVATLDFRIVVLDERADLSTAEWNPFAHDRRVLPYARVGRAIPSGPHSYVVIMTPDHRADELALRQVVRKRLRYLGVLGSARKAREMLEKLRATGCPPECLGRVRTPVGLPIASHTPAEIAISIAAQLIQERNRQEPPASGTEPAGILGNPGSVKITEVSLVTRCF